MSQAFKSMSHPSNREVKSEDTLPETTVKSIPGKEPLNFILETLKADAIIAGVLGVYRTGVKVNTNLLITFLSSSRSGIPSSSLSLSLSRSLSCSVFHESFLDLIFSWLYLHFHHLQFLIFISWLFDSFNVVVLLFDKVLSTWSESSLILFSEFWI